MNTDVRINRWTLEFVGNPEIEKEFLNEYCQKSLRFLRFALLLGIFLYAAFGLLDPVIVPDVKSTVWLIRYGIVCPAIIAFYIFTFSNLFKRVMQPALALYIMIPGLGIIVMVAISNPPGSYLYYAGLILCLMFAYAFLRMRFLYALGVSFSLAAAYEITAIWFSKTDIYIFINNNFFLVAAIIIGLSTCYSIEFYIRRSFLQQQIIKARTQELLEKNEELSDKNKELNNKNKELAQSREELLRSTKRTELVFAALSEALPGTVLDDKYRIEEKIGSGGFGTVYRATHILLQQPAAVKVFRPTFGADSIRNLDRFRVEGITASRVRHPNAVLVLDFGVSSSIAYMVMELLKGWSLKDELEKKETLSVTRTIDVLVPVCGALAEAHTRGIIHRDIKPSNIFLQQTSEGEIVKVVDFGLAKLVSDTLNPELQSLTETGSVLGTPVYMSPERLSNKPYDGEADIYSLGVMMYEMLCGRLPFETPKENYWSIVLMHITHTPVSPRTINEEIPESLETAIMRCLSKDPHERPTAKELQQTLKEFAGKGDDQSTERAFGEVRKPIPRDTIISHGSTPDAQPVDKHVTQLTNRGETIVVASEVEPQDIQAGEEKGGK